MCRPGPRAGRSILLLLLALLSLPASAQSEGAASLIERSDRFEFHSHFWLNLHHFLFDKAQRPDGQPMEGGRRLSRQEFAQIDAAIDWYRDELVGKSLLMDRQLYSAKRALITLAADAPPKHDAISAKLTEQLEAAAPVYRKYYWPRHDRQNREIVAWHRERIGRMEHRVLGRIAELAQQGWPDEIIRVDLTWDANWAGAYCTVEPIHVVITSKPSGPENTWPPGGWLELLFHEPSHAVIDPNSSAVGKTLNNVGRQLGHDNVGELWHAVLFLFSGTAVREALRDEGIDHQLLMVTEGIFSRHQPEVNEHFSAYIAGDEDLDSAAKSTLEALSRSGKLPPQR